LVRNYKPHPVFTRLIEKTLDAFVKIILRFIDIHKGASSAILRDRGPPCAAWEIRAMKNLPKFRTLPVSTNPWPC
jgi:hypothetical protein